MAVIVTRAGKGSPLTNNEVDDNFINLNAQGEDTAADLVATNAALAAKVTQEPLGIENTGVFYYNARTINQDVTIGGTENAMSVGPIEIADTKTVTVEDGGEWVIV